MNINKSILLVGLLLSGTSFVQADVDTKAMSEANRLGKSMINKDYMMVAKLTHPAVSKKFGGVKALSLQLKKSYTEANLTFLKMKFHKPSEIDSSGKFVVAKIPYDSRVQVANEKYDSSSFYLGFSRDKKTWYFSDCEGMSQGLLKALAPGYNGNINLKGC